MWKDGDVEPKRVSCPLPPGILTAALATETGEWTPITLPEGRPVCPTPFCSLTAPPGVRPGREGIFKAALGYIAPPKGLISAPA